MNVLRLKYIFSLLAFLMALLPAVAQQNRKHLYAGLRTQLFETQTVALNEEINNSTLEIEPFINYDRDNVFIEFGGGYRKSEYKYIYNNLDYQNNGYYIGFGLGYKVNMYLKPESGEYKKYLADNPISILFEIKSLYSKTTEKGKFLLEGDYWGDYYLDFKKREITAFGMGPSIKVFLPVYFNLYLSFQHQFLFLLTDLNSYDIHPYCLAGFGPLIFDFSSSLKTSIGLVYKFF